MEFQYIDLFSGCGGLSLGLLNSGWKGICAVEKNPDAFLTLSHNLITRDEAGYLWPDWLPQKPLSTGELLNDYSSHLSSLKGKVTLLAGGPPCQGFSTAGKRDPNDPRNQLVRDYIKTVEIILPRFLLLENVRGFTHAFSKGGEANKIPYSVIVAQSLEQLGYVVFHQMVKSSDFGVPQLRQRFILIAIKNNDPALKKLGDKTPFDLLAANTPLFRKRKGLPPKKETTVKDAISDLETEGKTYIDCQDSNVSGFKQIKYAPPKTMSKYQAFVRKGLNGDSPNSLRLARHRPATIEKFTKILKSCPKGHCLSVENRERLGMKKQATTPLHPHKVSATITTLPDDILHYNEPRILTVRENARIQSFPDWFEFLGSYTTGSTARKTSCPRYTQVGNAVPPLMAEAIGETLLQLAKD
ncbi:DNA cytosine methyltransferase [uncultured Pseudodesulfovibrio sp.]|uniref:DNA cytosine methyltransferase n=1 Tax=uncultured Pseudodesulfovibrio sp. TaxID=2035858 RepID=UPI00374A6C85